MNTVISKVLFAGIAFVLIFISGFWISAAGKPYPVLLFTVHKLASLAALIVLIMAARQMHQVVPLGTLELVAIVSTVILFAALIVTGGLLSVELSLPSFVNRLHHLMPWLTLLTSLAFSALLLMRK